MAVEDRLLALTLACYLAFAELVEAEGGSCDVPPEVAEALALLRSQESSAVPSVTVH